MQKPAAKPTMHSMGRSSQASPNNEVIADQIAAILAKRAAQESAANPDAWNAVDAAKIAVDAAKSAKQSMRIVTGEINNIQGAIDLMSMEIKTLRRNLSEMTDANASLKNTTILCGIGSAIAGGLLWSLIGAQSPQIQPTQGQTSQSVRVGR